jgi:2-oxoglutarate ferredoxin oxidoreductase subunit alpha
MTRSKDPSALQQGRSVSIALAGSGGSGVMTAGTMLLTAAAKAGLYGLMVRTSGPQIRGGEAAALIRLAGTPTEGLDDCFDLLLAIDWQNINRFADEVPLGASIPTRATHPRCSRPAARATSRCR